jgi:adenylate cyclase
MLDSPDFNATPQQTAFLKFVVNQTLAGKAREIKDDTVATEVFGRGPDFDHRIDPVVSIQADILRRALARYYLTAGKHDSIRITKIQMTKQKS